MEGSEAIYGRRAPPTYIQIFQQKMYTYLYRASEIYMSTEIFVQYSAQYSFRKIFVQISLSKYMYKKQTCVYLFIHNIQIVQIICTKTSVEICVKKGCTFFAHIFVIFLYLYIYKYLYKERF